MAGPDHEKETADAEVACRLIVPFAHTVLPDALIGGDGFTATVPLPEAVHPFAAVTVNA
jgi:hypothetical protein